MFSIQKKRSLFKTLPVQQTSYCFVHVMVLAMVFIFKDNVLAYIYSNLRMYKQRVHTSAARTTQASALLLTWLHPGALIYVLSAWSRQNMKMSNALAKMVHH